MAKERVERDEEDLVRLYLTDIGQYPLLTKEDEVRLAQQIEQGNSARRDLEDPAGNVTPSRKTQLKREVRRGEDAERTFVQSNLRLVVSIAKKYQASGLPLLGTLCARAHANAGAHRKVPPGQRNCVPTSRGRGTHTPPHTGPTHE